VTKRKAMTEPQWQESASVYPMLMHLHQQCNAARMPGGRRRLGLFRCACCRSVWNLFEDESCRRAVEVAERAADGKARREELAVAHHEAAAAEAQQQRLCLESRGDSGWWRAECLFQAAKAAAWTATTRFDPRWTLIVCMATRAASAIRSPSQPELMAAHAEHDRLQAGLLRDVFGNPFRPLPVIDPTWLAWHDRAIPKMAQRAYEERAFEQLPILADALEEAGCSDSELVGHCRGPGPHVRGCWVVDLLLARR
jgi:hypothetical protein